MKVAIIGSRDYAWDFGDEKPSVANDYWCGRPHASFDLCVPVMEVMDFLGPEDYVVSGAATGADWWGEKYAIDRRVGRIIHPAHWKKYGKPAGMIRNRLIIADADVVLAFFTDKRKSRGTVGSIGLAEKKGIPVYEFDASVDTATPAWYDTWYEDVRKVG